MGEEETLVRLPKEMRGELKEPLGDVVAETDRERLTGRVVAVGDMVTYYLLEAGVTPDVAVVDGKTEREEVDPEVVERWSALPVAARVENAPATVSREVVLALREALADDGVSLVEVEGEEDLVVLPAVVLASDGDTVLYGQPGEGMVYVDVNERTRGRALDLLRRMEGDEDALEDALGIAS
ncbi:MAG: GTP-dependent dephospho-CoA kinase family protein [Halobacteriales archaeon]|nr:GTP-dependent dephospho-CoA kinase family protein [Halobacteriales archaeon]